MSWVVVVRYNHYQVAISPGADGDMVDFDGNVLRVQSDWGPGEPLFRGAVGGADICVQIDRKGVAYRLFHAGAEIDVQVLSARAAELAAGMPVNLMEILAITQVFERRVINQYAVHGRAEGTHELVKSTIERIVEDEKWHIKWIRDALKNMEPEYGKGTIDDTVQRFLAADREVYEQTVREHEERVRELLEK